METSTNFGFNLPSRDNDDIADINQISDNFRIIDEKLAIDQTFSETSENPQSGIAVAQAVDTCSPAIITTSDTGKAIAINDGSESALKGLTAYGESTQDGTPAPDSPVEIVSVENPVISVYGKNLIPYPYINTTQTINGITFTDNGDGSITVNGTATANAYFVLTALNLYPKGIYYLSGGASGGGTSSYALVVRNREGASYTFLKYDYGSGVKIELSEDDTLMFEIRVYSGTTVDNLVFKPQLEIGTVATSYELYIEPQTVTVPYTFAESDTLTLKDGTVKVNISGEETDITATEAGQALLALKSNYPSTSVISDIDLNITYKADTKNYIDNKIAALTALTLEG